MGTLIAYCLVRPNSDRAVFCAHFHVPQTPESSWFIPNIKSLLLFLRIEIYFTVPMSAIRASSQWLARFQELDDMEIARLDKGALSVNSNQVCLLKNFDNAALSCSLQSTERVVVEEHI